MEQATPTRHTPGKTSHTPNPTHRFQRRTGQPLMRVRWRCWRYGGGEKVTRSDATRNCDPWERFSGRNRAGSRFFCGVCHRSNSLTGSAERSEPGRAAPEGKIGNSLHTAQFSIFFPFFSSKKKKKNPNGGRPVCSGCG